MMGRHLLVLVLLCSACKAELMDVNPDALFNPSADSGVDTPADATAFGPWTTPMIIPGASGAGEQDDGTLSASGLELVFALANAADANRKDLYIATRGSTAVAFGAPNKLVFSVVGSSEETPRFSADDKTLYFASDRAGGAGGLDIYKATRATIGGAWSAPALVAGPNTAASEKWFMPCALNTDDLVVSGVDLAAGTVGGAAPTVVAELSSAQPETGSFLSGDCLTAYFASSRSGTFMIYTSHRTSLATVWQAPTAVTDFAGIGGAQEDPWISADGRTFVFVSNIGGTKDVYITTR
jgi:Tol biopolymer transport system component